MPKEDSIQRAAEVETPASIYFNDGPSEATSADDILIRWDKTSLAYSHWLGLDADNQIIDERGRRLTDAEIAAFVREWMMGMQGQNAR